MLTYLLRRVALMIPTLIGMTLLLFVIVRFSPGVGNVSGFDAAGASSDADRAAQVKKVKQRLRMIDAEGRDISLPMQYVLWLKDSVQLDLGESIKYRQKVWDLIKERAPVTISINIIVTFIVYLVAVPGGLLSSARRGKSFDVGWSFTTLALYSLPTMWIGGMLIGIFANPQNLNLFPSAGLHATDTSRFTSLAYLRDYLWHLALPVFVLSYGSFAYLSKQMRASVLDNIGQDYARTARAKGLSGFVVVTRHVFRNSLLPLITIASGIIPGLIGGSVVVEQIFSIKGMGELAFQATLARDLPVIQAISLVSGVLVLISYLITDICYSLADPRVSYD